MEEAVLRPSLSLILPKYKKFFSFFYTEARVTQLEGIALALFLTYLPS